jgi:5-methylcytosine-specific restriction endonuclease McrA
METFSTDFDEGHTKRERRKARELRESQWWKRRLAKGLCHYCQRAYSSAELTMDHIVPISRGGRSTKGNVVPSCKACNNKKRYLLPMEWEDYLKSGQQEP